MLTVHVPVPEQAPLQPLNVYPAAGMTVRVTAVPVAKLALHVEPHDMPAGIDVTLPLPVVLTDSE